MENSNFSQDSMVSLKEMYLKSLWVIIFGIAFAWIEGSVVVYLREIYSGGSFSFPLILPTQANGVFLDDPLLTIEFWREFFTIVMLLATGILAGRNKLQKFCYFLVAFGIWDIFYYIWLYVMIGWPESIMTWDILFLIPLPWTGQVITPVLIAIVMVVGGLLVVYFDEKYNGIHFSWYDWVVETFCGILLIIAFCWDWKNILRYPDGNDYSGIPNLFAWWLYIPVFLFTVVYFGVRLNRIVKLKSGFGDG